MAAGHHAQRVHIGGLFVQRPDGVGILREGFGIDQAFAEALVHEAQGLSIGLGHRGDLHLAVADDAGIALSDLGEGGHDQAVHHVRALIKRPRDFVVGVAVAVGVLLLEGDQHVVELVQRGGHFHIDIFQPGAVDVGAHAVGGKIAVLVNAGEYIERAVGANAGVPDVGIALIQRHHIRRILFHRGDQIQKHAVNAQRIRLIRIAGQSVGAQDDVRQLVRVHHDLEFFLRGILNQIDPLEFHIALFGNLLHRVVGAQIVLRRGEHSQFGRRGAFGHRGQSAQRQNSGQNQRQETFHRIRIP